MPRHTLYTMNAIFALRPVGKGKNRTWCITDLQPRGDVVEIPESFEEESITALELSAEKVFLGVHTFQLGRNLTKLLISDFLFPDLQTLLVPEGSPFTTDGKEIREGEKVLYTLIGEPRKREGQKKEGKADQGLIIRGRTLLELTESLHTLVLPDEVREISAAAFARHRPVRLVAKAMPLFKGIPVTRPLQGGVKELILTGEEETFPLEQRRAFRDLAYLEVSKDSKDVRSVEGILYSRDAGTLLWVPPKRPGEELEITGVAQIGAEAFRRNQSLRRVVMGPSVQTVGKDAFYRCEKLEEVVFSDQIQVIPGSGKIGVYNLQAGFLGDCPALGSVHLPSSLRVLGMNAFVHSALTEIFLPEGLEEIGPKALDCPNLSFVRLPSTLKSIGEEALGHTLLVEATQGTAKGLMGAIPPGGRVLLRGRQESIVRPPISYSKEGPGLLSRVWDQEKISYEAYAQLFSLTKSEEVKMEMALSLCLALSPREAKPFWRFLSGKERALGELLMDSGQEALLSRFLSAFHLPPSVLSCLLEKANQEGKKEVAAQILEAGAGGNKRPVPFSL